MNAVAEKARRRTDEEIAADHETKAAELRQKIARRNATKTNGAVKRMFSTAKSLLLIAKDCERDSNGLSGECRRLSSDLQRAADLRIGQQRVDS